MSFDRSKFAQGHPVDLAMTETIITVICYLREKGKFDSEAKELAVRLIDLFVLKPKENNND